MRATSKDLRFHTKEIIKAAIRGEEVIITYHGKPCVKIVPIEEEVEKEQSTEFYGMWADRDDMLDVEGYIRKIRRGRYF